NQPPQCHADFMKASHRRRRGFAKMHMMFIDTIFVQIGQALGTLLPGPEPPEEPPAPGGLNPCETVNGVVLSPMIMFQLREACFNPHWCRRYELEAALRAASVDCDVFDEDDGDNFYDMLELDADEIAARSGHDPPDSFRDRLHKEREDGNGAEGVDSGH